MDEQRQIVKTALELIRAAGGTGVVRSRLLRALTTLDGLPLDFEQMEVVWGLLSARGWVTWHMEPVFHAKRWTITDAGLTALEAL